MQKEPCPTERSRRIGISHHRAYSGIPPAVRFDQSLRPVRRGKAVILGKGHKGRIRLWDCGRFGAGQDANVSNLDDFVTVKHRQI
jgi:hypothetical protein